jgi:hypothetical protein
MAGMGRRVPGRGRDIRGDGADRRVHHAMLARPAPPTVLGEAEAGRREDGGRSGRH